MKLMVSHMCAAVWVTMRDRAATQSGLSICALLTWLRTWSIVAGVT